MIKELTQRFIDKVAKDDVNLRLLEKEIGIPYDRMFKWKQGKSNPKPPDDKVIEDWINGRSSKNVQTETTSTNIHPHSQEVIDLLKAEVERLKGREQHLKDLNNNLSEEIKKQLKEMQTSLSELLRNQSTIDASMQASVYVVLKKLAANDQEYDRLARDVDNVATAIELENKKRGNRVEIDILHINQRKS